MPKSSKNINERQKNCELCKNSIKVAFRVKISKNNPWIFVCKSCCQNSANLADYQYGGTWKGQKK